jgi:hypothetical protein
MKPSTVQMRDLSSIYAKLLQVLYPPKQGGSNELLRYVNSVTTTFLLREGSQRVRTQANIPFCFLVHSEWDLWGPLVICLALAIILSIDVNFSWLSSVNPF